MAKIKATLWVDEEAVKEAAETDSLADAISGEFGWLHDSGMEVDDWEFIDNDGPVDDPVMVEDVTGTLGEWFDRDTSDIPQEALALLQQAYRICADAL